MKFVDYHYTILIGGVIIDFSLEDNNKVLNIKNINNINNISISSETNSDIVNEFLHEALGKQTINNPLIKDATSGFIGGLLDNISK